MLFRTNHLKGFKMKKIFLALQLLILSLGLVCISDCAQEKKQSSTPPQTSTSSQSSFTEPGSTTESEPAASGAASPESAMQGEIATTGVISETNTATTIDGAAVQLAPEEQ